MEGQRDKNNKRGGDDSLGMELDFSEFKRTRLDSCSTSDGCVSDSGTFRVHSDVDAAPPEFELNRASFESRDSSNDMEQLLVETVSSHLDSPEAKRIQDDLLNCLEETDNVLDRDLDSVMKSFAEELLHPGSNMDPEEQEIRPESLPDLGYLLDASDNELGLPLTWTSSEENSLKEDIDSVCAIPEAMGFNGFVEFEDDITSYDSFDFRFDDTGSNPYNPTTESVTWGGVPEYSELGDSLWRPEYLHAM